MKHTKETKAKMSKSRLGKRHSEETKSKISKAHLGKVLSKEHKTKLSKTFCLRGHEMSKTRKRGPDGTPYCSECAKEKYYELKSTENGRKKLKSYQRNSALKAKYGIDQQEFNRMLKNQGKKCRICLRNPKDKETFHVDHDHDTGEIRGILCSGCNRGLGLLRDNEEIVASALKYLRKTTC